MFFFFKQKTAYEMRISDWSSDVCSSDLGQILALVEGHGGQDIVGVPRCLRHVEVDRDEQFELLQCRRRLVALGVGVDGITAVDEPGLPPPLPWRRDLVRQRAVRRLVQDLGELSESTALSAMRREGLVAGGVR